MRPILLTLLSIVLTACATSSPNTGNSTPGRDCRVGDWNQAEPPAERLLDLPEFFRGRRYVGGFTLETVAPFALKTGIGGRRPKQQIAAADVVNTIKVRMRAAANGTGSEYLFEDHRHAKLAASSVAPPHNQLTGIVREETSLYVSYNYDGNAKEIGFRGNELVAIDLCAQQEMWRSAPMSANAGFIVYEGLIFTGYGYTAEDDFVLVLDRRSGRPIQKITIPSAPLELRLAERGSKLELYVRFYDGYVKFRVNA